MLNNCTFIGRLTRTPQLRKTQSEKSVSSFQLAVDRSRPNKDGEWLADFLDFEAWNGLAEKVCKYQKGDLLTVQGRLEIHPYKNREGQTIYSAVIVAEGLRKISSPKNTSPQASSPAEAQSEKEGFTEMDEPGDLPY